MAGTKYSNRERAQVVIVGPVLLLFVAAVISGVSHNHLGLDHDTTLTYAQVIPALLIALVFESRAFDSSKKRERENLSCGAATVLLVGVIGEVACFVVTGRDHYLTFWSAVVVSGSAVLGFFLVASPLLRGR